MSRLLKYVLLVFPSSFLQKLGCNVYAFLSEKGFDFQKLLLDLELFIMAL